MLKGCGTSGISLRVGAIVAALLGVAATQLVGADEVPSPSSGGVAFAQQAPTPCVVVVGEFPLECTPTPIRIIGPILIQPTETPSRLQVPTATAAPRVTSPTEPGVPPIGPFVPVIPTATPTGPPGLVPVAPVLTAIVAPTATPTTGLVVQPFPTLFVAPTPTRSLLPGIILPPALIVQGDLEPVRIDVIQTISARFGTDDPEIPLVAGKRTLVRVYVQLTDVDEAREASVSLSARRGGQDVGLCNDGWLFDPQKQVNPGSLANPIIALLVRDDLSRTFNFDIPPTCSQWLASGNVTFRATVHGQQCVGCASNDTREKTVQFYTVRQLKVKPYVITYTRSGPNQGKAPLWTTSGFDYLQSVFPVPSVDIKYPGFLSAPTSVNLDVEDDDTWWDEYGELLDWFANCCGSTTVDSNLGLLHTDVVGGAGIAYYGRYALSGAGKGGTYAHEIGHNFYLPHSSNVHDECGGGSCDPNWIYPHGGLTGHGWNFLRSSKLIVPTGAEGGGWHAHDTMSYGGCADGAPGYNGSSPWYCANWMSPLNYARIAQRLRCADPQWALSVQSIVCLVSQAPFINVINAFPTPPTMADERLHELRTASRAIGPPGESALRAAQPPQEGEYLWVTARLRDDGRAEFRPFYRLLSRSEGGDYVGEGSYRIDLVDADGNNLVSRNFEPARLSAHARVSRSVVDELVRWHPATTRIVLRRGAAVLAERQVSANEPTVTLLSPNGGEQWPGSGEETIRWTAADADGDMLSFWLLYSADGGQSWDTIERNVQGTSYAVDLRNLAGSAQAMVRILATDGVNTVMDSSDRAFVVARKAPLVGIMELDDEQQVRAGEPLTLRGVGVDHEDGTLPGTALSWLSDLDGPLGTGETLAVRLSPGEHVITLVGRDSDGQEGTAALRIVVQ